MLQYIANGEPGLDVRNALNSMFTELYGAISPYQPIILLGVDSNYNLPVPANYFITNIYIKPVSGAITLNIGTSPNGGEILPDMLIDYTLPIAANLDFPTPGNLYFTLSGTGTLNITIYFVIIA